MENAFKINTFQLNFNVSLICANFRVLKSLFWSFSKGPFIRETSNTLKYHNCHNVLLIESHFKPWTIQNKIDDTIKIILIFDEWEDILAFCSINFFTFAST